MVPTLGWSLWAAGFSAVQASTPIAYGSFVKSATYSIANQLGYFTEEGLNVTYAQVPNSSFAYDGLLAGTYDILTGTIDNAVNLAFNSKANLTGSDIVLAATSTIETIHDLRGKLVMVDAASSGYSFVLRRLLSFYGLQYGADYSFQVVGGTPFRYQALLDGYLSNGSAVYATVLTYPYTGFLEIRDDSTRRTSSGPHILARVADFVAPFSSQTLTVRTSTLTNTDTPAYHVTVAFVRAMLRANRLLADPQRRGQARDAIAAELGGIDEATAARELAAATDAVTGETAQSEFQVSMTGLWNVIGIRDRFGGFAGAGDGFDFVEAVAGLVDYGVRDAARNGVV
ncbi:hypothetical protein PG987_010531 [Apiospora arundinis]